MAFNITSWSQKGRDYGRGEPPPRGSIEYVGVGDMFQPTPPAPKTAAAPAAPKTAAAPRPAPAPAAPLPRKPPLSGTILLAAGGAAYLGLRYLITKPRPATPAVAVPDALEEE